MDTSLNPLKVAFIFDDRLPHDRKTIFARTATILKSRFAMEILPTQMTEDELITHLQKNEYGLILLPWYKYIAWKKLESFFGALRMQGPTVAGYFADAVLPFEFAAVPHYHRFLFLDFYRFDQNEIELMVAGLVHPDKRSGFSGIFGKNSTVYYADWYDNDQSSTRCLDAVLKTPLLQNSAWQSRHSSLRFYMTALWSLCFQEKHSFPDATPCAQLEIAEINKRLAIKLVFESSELTLKQMMEYVWPSGSHHNQAVNELVRHADFLRIHHFPESHHIEVTAFFSPTAPSLHHPGEVRGFWIEPLKKKFLKSAEDEIFSKRLPIHQTKSEQTTENLQTIIESFRQVLIQLNQNTSPEERAAMESQVANIRFLLHEVEKRIPEKFSEKVAEKKKIA
jgi:hypothetical protein